MLTGLYQEISGQPTHLQIPTAVGLPPHTAVGLYQPKTQPKEKIMFRNPTTLKLVYGLFVLIALSINAVLTFQFGATNAAAAFPYAGTLAPVLGGLFLTVFYDAAAWASLAAYSLAETVQQRGLALWSLAISILASVISSILQIALTNSLYIVPVEVSTLAAFVGLVMMLFVAGSHFLCIIAYTMSSRQYQEEDADIDLKAKMESFRLNQRKKMAAQVESRVESMLAKELPSLVDAEAQGQLDIMRTLLLAGSRTGFTDGQTIEGEFEQDPQPATPARPTQTNRPPAPPTPNASPVATMAAQPVREEAALVRQDKDTPL